MNRPLNRLVESRPCKDEASSNQNSVSGAKSESSPSAHPWPAETRMLRLAEVIRRTGLGKTKLYELQKAGRFPRSVHVTETAVRWIDSEVEAWLTKQARARFAISNDRSNSS